MCSKDTCFPTENPTIHRDHAKTSRGSPYTKPGSPGLTFSIIWLTQEEPKKYLVLWLNLNSPLLASLESPTLTLPPAARIPPEAHIPINLANSF